MLAVMKTKSKRRYVERVSIGIHDLEIIDCMDIAMSFLGNASMNKIMGATTINQNDDLHMLDLTNYLEGLWSRETSESI
jgi:hypothetical protein